MSYVIEDNSFTKDSYGLRLTRLSLISANLAGWAAEINLPADLLTWANGAHLAWIAKIQMQQSKQAEKGIAYDAYHAALDSLLTRYNALKAIIMVNYHDKEDLLKHFGLPNVTSTSSEDLLSQAYKFIGGNRFLHAEGDTRVLPTAMVDAFEDQVQGVEQLYQEAMSEVDSSLDSTDSIVALFDIDTLNLRKVYTWAVATWGKKSSNLLTIGFAETEDRTGGDRPLPPTGLNYNSGETLFSWNAAVTATSYQLAYKLDVPHIDEWQVAYDGPNTNAPFNPGAGTWLFKVRARNANGYGEFSGSISVIILEGDAPDAPDTPNL